MHPFFGRYGSGWIRIGLNATVCAWAKGEAKIRRGLNTTIAQVQRINIRGNLKLFDEKAAKSP